MKKLFTLLLESLGYVLLLLGTTKAHFNSITALSKEIYLFDSIGQFPSAEESEKYRRLVLENILNIKE